MTQLTFLDTVSQATNRCLLQFVDKESATVGNFDVVLPTTLVTRPVITDLTLDFALRHSWMLPVKPARSMRTTVICRWR